MYMGSTEAKLGLLAFWLLFLGGSSTLIWPREGSNCPSWSCNGPNGPKGPKLKQKQGKT